MIAAAATLSAKSELRAADGASRPGPGDDEFSTNAEQDVEPFPFVELEPDAPRRTEPPPFRYLTAKVSAGITLRHFYEDFIYAGDFTLALGSNTNDQAGHYYGLIHGSFGRTLAGLVFAQFRMGILHEWSIDRFRVGFTPAFGWLVIGCFWVECSRAASTLLIGFEPHASVDLMPFFEHARPPAALYLVVRAGLDFPLTATPTGLGGGALALGVRF